MGDPISQHCLKAVDTIGMSEIVKVRPAIALFSVHYPAAKKDFTEVMVYRGFAIIARTSATLKKEDDNIFVASH